MCLALLGVAALALLVSLHSELLSQGVDTMAWPAEHDIGSVLDGLARPTDAGRGPETGNLQQQKQKQQQQPRDAVVLETITGPRSVLITGEG